MRASQVPPELPDTGSLRGDLFAAAMHFAGAHGRSGRVLASLLTAIGTDADLYEAAYRDVGQPPLQALVAVIERWIERGLVASTVRVGLIAGIVPTAASGSVVLRRQSLDEQAVRELVDFVLLPALGVPRA